MRGFCCVFLGGPGWICPGSHPREPGCQADPQKGPRMQGLHRGWRAHDKHPLCKLDANFCELPQERQCL
jgi:hypothetical protein